MQKTILITGGAGFVGSNLAIYLKKRNKDWRIVCFDNLIRRGSELNVKRLRDAGINFIKGDIRNKKELLRLPKIDWLLECSAEPSVLAGFKDPQYTIDTNLVGTIHCLELARRDKAKFLFLSTSRVYPVEQLNAVPCVEGRTRFDIKAGAFGRGYSRLGIKEDFPLIGVKSLYGATKLSSEQIMAEYADIFGIDVIINRCGVIAGPWQMGRIDQGIVGFWIAQYCFNGPLSYIGFGGTGKQVRDVIHIDDICDLLDYQMRHSNAFRGKLYNVGGGRKNAVSLQELSKITEDVTGIKKNIASVKKDRRADVRIYISDNSAIYKATGWSPQLSITDIVRDTHEWIENNSSSLKKILG